LPLEGIQGKKNGAQAWEAKSLRKVPKGRL